MSLRRPAHRPYWGRFSALLLASLMLPPASLAEGLPDLGEPAQEYLTPAMEKRIGQAVLNEYRNAPEFIDDPEITEYVSKLGHRLSRNSDDPNQTFEFFVLRDSTLNAFAMPGGYIGVHSGLILAAQSESELAAVLAHEVSHVTQRHLARLFSKQSQSQIPVLVAMAVALLAARNNSNVAAGGVAAAQAFSIQNQLNYSRDFEREADRVGLNVLERSGFDVRGMEAFFERLQKFGRLYENNAPAYLRTHPLTGERIADMGNRVQSKPYRQVRDSLEFLLVKAKLKASEGQARDAVADFSAQLREGKYASEVATRFGLAHAHLRNQNAAAAAQELAELHKLKVSSPMIDSLAALVLQKQGDSAGGEKMLREAMKRYPDERSLSYILVELLQTSNQHEAALRQLSLDQQFWPSDSRIYMLQAKSHAALGRQLQQHRALAEAHALRGQWPQAVQQMVLAQKSPDGNFFEYSQVEARLRELKQKQADEAKEKLPN